MKLGYLGPRGTFTEKAANTFASDDTEFIVFNTIWEVLEAVNSSVVDYGIVPIENSTEGAVNVTVDSLIFDVDLFINKQITLPIEHSLIAKEGADIKSFAKILSHPQALAQCREFLRKNYPSVPIIETASTARAIKEVSESSENIAAIGIKEGADIYKLKVYDSKIQDSNDNFTEFICVSKNETEISLKGRKTSLAFSTANKPGELYKLLDIFSLWDLNMTKIVSRPMRKKTGEYVFFVDIEGNTDDKDLFDALTMIKRKTSFFKILGSYPVLNLHGISLEVSKGSMSN